MWTPPHFWALALFKKDDYAKAGVPMLPNVAGDDETRRQILIYTLLLMPLAFLPALTGIAGALYCVGVTTLNAAFLHSAIKVYRLRDEPVASRACKQLFGYSILWLFLVFALILIERAIGLPAFPAMIG